MPDPNQQNNNGGAGGGGGGSPWYGDIPAERSDLKTWVDSKGFANPISALESYHNAEKLLGAPADQIIRLPKADDKAGWDGVWNRLGRPEKPEAYELPVPEGDDGAFAKVAASAFHQAGVPKPAAQAIAKAVNDHVAQAMQARTQQLEQQAKQELDALKNEWGNEYDKRAEFARRGLKAYGEKAGLKEEDLTALEAAIGTSKMLKLFTALGETTGEHDFGGGGDSSGLGLSPAQAKAKLEEARAQRIEGKMGEKDYLALMDKLGPLAAKAT